MFAKSLETSQFYIIQVASFKISNSDSVGVEIIRNFLTLWEVALLSWVLREMSGIFQKILGMNFGRRAGSTA